MVPSPIPPHKITYEMVPLDKCYAEVQPGQKAQRIIKDEVNDPRVVKRYAEWDPSAVGVIIVAKTPKGYAVIDGYCRVCVARLKGYKELYAEVHHGTTIQARAALFRRHNKDAKQVTVVENYEVGLTEGDPVCVAVDAVLRKHNLTVGRTGPDAVGSIAQCMNVVRDHGQALFERVVSFMDATWSRGEKRMWDGMILTGLAEFFAAHPEVKDADLRVKVAMHHPEHHYRVINNIASQDSTRHTGTGNRRRAGYVHFLDLYNKRRKTKLRPLAD